MTKHLGEDWILAGWVNMCRAAEYSSEWLNASETDGSYLAPLPDQSPSVRRSDLVRSAPKCAS